jgi:hypothetical protein
VRNNQTAYRTIARKDSNRAVKEIIAMMGEAGEFLRPIVRVIIREFLAAEPSGNYLFLTSSREGQVFSGRAPEIELR